jgi:hypothetical protein
MAGRRESLLSFFALGTIDVAALVAFLTCVA